MGPAPVWAGARPLSRHSDLYIDLDANSSAMEDDGSSRVGGSTRACTAPSTPRVSHDGSTAAAAFAAAASPAAVPAHTLVVRVNEAHLTKLCALRVFGFMYLMAHVVQVVRDCRQRGEPIRRYAGSVHATSLGAAMYVCLPLVMATSWPAAYARHGTALNIATFAYVFLARVGSVLIEPGGMHDQHFVLEGLGVCMGSPGRPLYALFFAAALWRLLELPPRAFQWAMALRLATLVHHAAMLFDHEQGNTAGHLHPLIRTAVLSVGGYVAAHVLMSQAVPRANLAAASAQSWGRRLPAARRWLYRLLSTCDGAMLLGLAGLSGVHLLTSLVDFDAYRSGELMLVTELCKVVQ
ncbi:hypothetical protein TSOC_007044, partial [Tetrabaena socialis]